VASPKLSFQQRFPQQWAFESIHGPALAAASHVCQVPGTEMPKNLCQDSARQQSPRACQDLILRLLDIASTTWPRHCDS
jgi:hypothetical protein